MAAYAEGFNILKHAGVGKQKQDVDAETTPLRNPELYQYDLNLADIAEVWRRGSVIASWLLDLTAQALLQSPELAEFSGRVSDSGEGRWTIDAAIDEGVPSPVLERGACLRGSARAAPTITPTSSSRRCGSPSAATWKRKREAGSGPHVHAFRTIRRPGVFRRDRRPGLQEGLPRAPDLDPARPSRRADRRCRQGRLGAGAVSGPGARQPRGSTAASTRPLSPSSSNNFGTSTAITTIRPTFIQLRQCPRSSNAPAPLPGDTTESLRHGRRRTWQVWHAPRGPGS